MTGLNYDQWSAERPNGRFTDWLRELAEPTWTRAATHRFTTELADGTLPDNVMRRYLVQDYSFLNSFVKLVASAVTKAPMLADRIPLCQFLSVVTSEENTYFQRAFDALDVMDAERVSPMLRLPTVGFHEVMADAARSTSYEETLAPLVVFEWLYLTWASAVSDRRPQKFYLAEWIAIHANPDFAAFVEWLREQLDRGGPRLPRAEQDQVRDLFLRAVSLELAFFDDAYKGENPAP